MTQGAHFLQSPVYITPNKASKSAIKAVEQMGGYVYCVYATPLTVRNTVRNIQDKIQAGPIKRADIGTIMRFSCLLIVIDA